MHEERRVETRDRIAITTRVAIHVLCAAAPLGAQGAPSETVAPPPLALVQPGLRTRIEPRAASDSGHRVAATGPTSGEVFGRAAAGTLGAALGAVGGGLAGAGTRP